MVIIVSREGQLGNRIIHASSFIANAKENNYKVVHLFFDDYYRFFSERLHLRKKIINFWGKRRAIPIIFFQNLVTLFVKTLSKLKIKKLPFFELIEYNFYEQGSKEFNLNDQEFIKKAKSKIVLVYGWLFRDPVNIKKHKSLILETWVPNEKHISNIEKYYQNYKRAHDLLIGVHIRRGDYEKFEGGKWFYSPEQYLAKMKEVACLEKFRSKRIAFVICSNENVSLFNTEKFSVFIDERHFVEDAYLLSKCDYIIGPPSTFTIWASFFGDVPLYMLDNISYTITDEIFEKNAQVR